MKKIHKIILAVIGIILLIALGVFVYIKVTYISKAEAREIVLNQAQNERDNIHITKVELDIEENLYEVEFYYFNHDVEYESKINAKTGRIIYTNFNRSSVQVNTNQNNTNQSSNTQNNTNQSSNTQNNTNQDNENNITIEKAKQIALEDAKAKESEVIFTETKRDLDDGIVKYDIEFIYNNYKYDYEITETGEIISYSKDR